MPRSTTIRAEPPDPALHYRGWVHVGTADRIRRQRSTTWRRFGRDLEVSSDGAGGFVAHDRVHPHRRVPVVEQGGVVFVYHAAPGDDPDEPPARPSATIGEVLSAPSGFRSSFHFQMHSSLPTLVENAVDRAHFPAVHARHCDAAGPYEIDVEDGGRFWAKVDLGTSIPPGFRRQGAMEVEFFDPFSSRVRTEVLGRPYDLMVFSAPMGRMEVDILFVALSPRWFPILDRAIHVGMTMNQRLVVRDDGAVLATRTISPRPVLSDADGPIMAIRQWLTAFRTADPDDVTAPSRATVEATA